MSFVSIIIYFYYNKLYPRKKCDTWFKNNDEDESFIILDFEASKIRKFYNKSFFKYLPQFHLVEIKYLLLDAIIP